MINANVLFKKGCDKHLNVFWQYDGRPWLENNITKAFINTFESLDDDSKRHFLKKYSEFHCQNRNWNIIIISRLLPKMT